MSYVLTVTLNAAIDTTLTIPTLEAGGSYTARDVVKQINALSQTLGVQSISINPQSGVIAAPAPSSSGSAGSSTPTTVHPGAQEVDATVAVVFTIAPVAPPQ